MVILGFYFYLRSCKYTKCTGHRRTVQFRPLMDFVFFVGDRLLPADALIEQFQHATQIVLNLDNQKNVIRRESVSHFGSESAVACSVRAGVNIFLCMRKHGCPGATPISDYPTAQGLRSVSASDIITVLRADTIRVGKSRLGFAPEDVGTYSLCCGGAMPMHLAYVPDRTLMAIGRWHFLEFMVYIQQQISSFSLGVLVKMSRQPSFRNN